MEMANKMTDSSNKLIRSAIPLQELTIGAFKTVKATVEIYEGFFTLSFLDEAEKRSEIRLDLESISHFDEHYDKKGIAIRLVLRPKKIEEFAKKTPKGYEFCSEKIRRNPYFPAFFEMRLSYKNRKIVPELILSVITPPNSPLQSTFDSIPAACKVNPLAGKPCALQSQESTSHIQSVAEQKEFASSKKLETKFYKTNEKRCYRPAKQPKPKASGGNRGSAGVKFDRFNDGEILMSYPPGSDNFITMENYKCLEPRAYMDNAILDFYIQYVFHQMMNDEMRKRVHICSSSFYSLYSSYSTWREGEDKSLSKEMKRYLRVNNLPCIKDANIFEKDFIVFPCHDTNHWFLVIACYPLLNGAITVYDGTPAKSDALFYDVHDPKAGKPIKRSCIVAFDSIVARSGRRLNAMINIRNFMDTEYNTKYRNKFLFKKDALVMHSATCPEQKNGYDCGLYMLEFFERFFVRSPITDFRFPINLSKWFTENDIIGKRERIAQIIQTFIYEQKGKLPDLPPLRFGEQDMNLVSNPEVEILKVERVGQNESKKLFNFDEPKKLNVHSPKDSQNMETLVDKKVLTDDCFTEEELADYLEYQSWFDDSMDEEEILLSSTTSTEDDEQSQLLSATPQPLDKSFIESEDWEMEDKSQETKDSSDAFN